MKSRPVVLEFGHKKMEINLPENTDVLSMKTPGTLTDPASAIQEALDQPINSPALDQLIEDRLKENEDVTAVIVISDNTRPVPYKGEKGILWPIVERLINKGVSRDNILILVAAGTHRALAEDELREMIDPRIFAEKIRIKNHYCRDKANLTNLGETSRGSNVFINSDYIDADIKILTGLVESHFMAGVSGGRKSVCPGLAGEESTYIFHGAEMLASPEARDLVLEGNPCHEEALEVARMAGVDFIVNVTLDFDFNLTGVFAGELEGAHLAAVERIKEYVTIPFSGEYDLVVTHGGFVGINHYQVAKVGVVATPLLKPTGKLIVVSSTTDDDPIGSPNYKTTLHLLKLFGAQKFKNLILSPDWQFIPEQWQVQMWAKLFSRIPQENFIFYSPYIDQDGYQILAGEDGNQYLPVEKRYSDNDLYVTDVVENSVREIIRESGRSEDKLRIAFLADGPYGIPVAQ